MATTMEERFNLLLDPPKILKVRVIVAALHNVDIDRIPESHGMVKAKMRHGAQGLGATGEVRTWRYAAHSFAPMIGWDYGMAVPLKS